MPDQPSVLSVVQKIYQHEEFFDDKLVELFSALRLQQQVGFANNSFRRKDSAFLKTKLSHNITQRKKELLPNNQKIRQSVQIHVRSHGNQGSTHSLQANSQPQWVVAHEQTQHPIF